jgi:hypothetical protein
MYSLSKVLTSSEVFTENRNLSVSNHVIKSPFFMWGLLSLDLSVNCTHETLSVLLLDIISITDISN